MRVHDVMTGEVVTAHPSQTISDVAAVMTRHETGSLVVMEQDRIVGIITERDIIGLVARTNDPSRVSASEVMSKDVVTVGPDTRLSDAAALMVGGWFRHLPVISADGSLEGMLSVRDLAGWLVTGMDGSKRLARSSGSKLVRQRRLERISAGDLD